MNPQDRIEALKMELFDEYEELGAFLGHYFVLVAGNNSSKPWLCPRSHDWQYINWKRDMLLNGNMAASSQCHHESQSTSKKLVLTTLDHKPIKRRFSAVAEWEDGFLIQGGLSSTTRLATSLHLRPATNTSVFEVYPRNTRAQMCHTMIKVDDGVLLIGGRDAPNSGTTECQYFGLRDRQGGWNVETQVPLGPGKQAIYRHAVTTIGKDQVVLFGGRRVEGLVTGEWLRYDRSCKRWDGLDCHNTCPALWGASICWRNGVGVLVGGMTSEGECAGDVYTWRLEGTTVKLKSWSLHSHSRALTRRYGAKIIPYGDDDFLIVGGAGSHRVLTWSEQFLLFSPATESIRTVDVPIAAGVEPWLVGHDAAVHESSGDIVVVGGGGVCFSFGSFWNEKILQLSNPSRTTSIKSWQLLEETSVDSRSNQPLPNDGNGTPPKQIRRVRIDNLQQWHDQVMEKSEVCILEGLPFGDCIPKWTPEYLKSSVGDKPVVIHSTMAYAMNFLQKNFQYTTRSFADFIETVFAGNDDEKVYLRAVSDDAKNKPAGLQDDFPTLAPDFEIPTFLREGGIEKNIFSTVLRIGGIGTSMWLHYDVFRHDDLGLMLGDG